ncbi:hypothetical protein ACFFIS_05930 [Virgibacillus soli]|uniref:hypothetical protein n=1 Tax=Paracerasibacillus soli TaxID=480284 RepID=UPI0035E78B66
MIELKVTKPDIGTKSGAMYFSSTLSDLDFFFFIIDTVLIGDYIPYHAKKTLELADDLVTESEVAKSPEELMQTKPGNRVKKLRKHSQEFIEMIYSRQVDNFQTYIVNLVREILKVQPNILHNNHPHISIAQLLEVESKDELINEVIENKVSSLANKGFGHIEEWCKASGIPLTVDRDLKSKLKEFIAIRNIIVHNRCIVDEKYLRVAPQSKYKKGSIRKLDVDDLYEAINIFSEIVKHTDKKSIEKFNLEESRLNK